jgi:Fe-S-cluster containining protein
MKVIRPPKGLGRKIEKLRAILKANEGLLRGAEYSSLLVLLDELADKIKKDEPIPAELLERLRSSANELLHASLLSKPSASMLKSYLAATDALYGAMAKALETAEYDFFVLCGRCGKCCESPHVFSFETPFIEKYFEKLEEKGGYFSVRNKGGRCAFYDARCKRCSIYKERPLDCKLFPYSFIVKRIEAENIDVAPRDYIFLLQAKGCPVAKRLATSDAISAFKLVKFILSKIDSDEARTYSSLKDPNRMEFTFSAPYS